MRSVKDKKAHINTQCESSHAAKLMAHGLRKVTHMTMLCRWLGCAATCRTDSCCRYGRFFFWLGSGNNLKQYEFNFSIKFIITLTELVRELMCRFDHVGDVDIYSPTQVVSMFLPK